jgi:ferredoxin-thioredoxin reductase catalytic subunit
LRTLEEVRRRAESDAKTHGYYLNPESNFCKDLLEGLKTNEKRYGYPSCPCRLALGNFDLDRDIICPCDYRDIDVEEYGVCYCSLYVSKDVFEGKKSPTPIPERRPLEKIEGKQDLKKETTIKKSKKTVATPPDLSKLNKKLWYCKQCGYVVFREEPPYLCPICKAKREMFGEIYVHMTT